MPCEKKLKPLGDVAACVVAMVFLSIVYLTIYFIVSAYVATDHGLIEWGEGWKAVKELLAGTE